MSLFSMIVLAQTPYNIQIQDEIISVEENISSFEWDNMPESSKFENGYYGWVQFFETPTQKVQDDFKRRGLELMQYIPNKAYVFYFPESTSIQYLKDNGVRAIIPVDGRFKLSSEMKMASYPEYALEGNNILVKFEYHKHANSNDVVQELLRQEIVIKREYKGYNIMDISIPNNCLEALSNMSFVKWIELTRHRV